jgi:hypothetical protein
MNGPNKLYNHSIESLASDKHSSLLGLLAGREVEVLRLLVKNHFTDIHLVEPRKHSVKEACWLIYYFMGMLIKHWDNQMSVGQMVFD